MFKIKSYLQYKNTPDGKPRVLKQTKSYKEKENTYHYVDFICLSSYDSDGGVNDEDIANLSDCRPLLTVKIGRKEFTEGDIITEQFCKKGCFETYMFFLKNGKIKQEKFDYKFDFDFCTFNSVEKQEEQYKKIVSILGKIKPEKNVVASFFDDPKKWSKILWNCTESEGWKKIFKLLNLD